MKYAYLVAWREFSESIKAKGFWIGIFVMPVVFFFSIKAPMWLEQKATPVRHFVVVDQSRNFAPLIESSLEREHQQRVFWALKDYARKYAAPVGKSSGEGPSAKPAEGEPRSVEEFASRGGKDAFLKQLEPRLKTGAPQFQEPRRTYQSVKPPPDINPEADLAAITEQLKPYLRGEKKLDIDNQSVELAAAVLIPRDIEAHIVRPSANAKQKSEAGTASAIQFWAVNSSDPRLHDDIERAINSEIRQREYLARGMDSSVVSQIEATHVPFTSLNPKKEKGNEKVGTADTVRQWAPSGFVYLLWLSIFMIVQMLLTNTIEEKSNRIIEVLLSSVTPGELMMGKLFGIAAVGLTMVAAWMSSVFVILSLESTGASGVAGQILTVLKGSNLVFLFSLYFVLGYLMYAGIILAIGSVCNTLKEAQSYMSVLTLIMMVPLMTMTFIPKDPNGTLARVLSWIPPYSPFTMMNRASADPPLVDMAGTLVLMVVTTVGALWMSGKVFRIGVLRTGQPPKIVEMLQWALRRE